MPTIEMATPRPESRESAGSQVASRVFKVTEQTSHPPYDGEGIPPDNSEHPAYPNLFLSRKSATPLGFGNGWIITCEYATVDLGGNSDGNPRPLIPAVGTWRWGEVSKEVQIKCPIAILQTKTVDAAQSSFVYYKTETQNTTADASELTIDIVNWEPSLADRVLIKGMIGEIHKIGDDPAEYKFKGCDMQHLGQAKDQGVFRRVVRYIYKWDGDDGSWPPCSETDTFAFGTLLGYDRVIFPNAIDEDTGTRDLLYRDPHTYWATAPTFGEGSGVTPPDFYLVRTARNIQENLQNWLSLPGMNYVTIT